MIIRFEEQYGTLAEVRGWYQKYINDPQRVGLSSKGIGADTLEKRLQVREIRPGLAKLLEDKPQESYRVLDVGAGLATTLGTLCNGKPVEVTAIDPMAKYCNILLDEAGLVPPVRTQFGFAESIGLQFPDDHFDMVFSENGFDHFSDPVRGLQAMYQAVKPGCFLVACVCPREGENNGYTGMHAWNVDLFKNGPVLWGLNGKPRTIFSILGKPVKWYWIKGEFSRLLVIGTTKLEKQE